MSQNNLNYDTAASVILQEVFAPVFFSKLAEYGIQPASEDEAQRLLQAADKIRYQDQLEQTKVASSRGGLIDRMHQHLDQKLGKQPVSYDHPSVKSAAARLANTPLVRDAALLFQDGLNRLQPAA